MGNNSNDAKPQGGDALVADIATRVQMLTRAHERLIERNKRAAASSDFQYDLAYCDGLISAAAMLGLDVAVHRSALAAFR